nr:uncharacterized protein LOC105348282 [Crassostrea gigas]
MDQSNSAQDAVRCTLCQSPENLVFCEVCHTRLVCKYCHEKYPYASENHTAVIHKQYLTNCTDLSLMDEPQFDSLSALSSTTEIEIYNRSPQGAESSPPDRSLMNVPQFGSLSALSFTTEEQDYSMSPQGAESSPPDRSLMDVPQIITTLDTEFGYLNGVTCVNDNDVWTCGNENTMKLYNLQEELLKSIQTESGNEPRDITVTKDGNLVYTDYKKGTVNIVQNSKAQESISIQEWKPHGVCTTSLGDFLVVMDNIHKGDVKVVRYSGSTEKPSIKPDDKGQPLYLSTGYIKYISENRNQDICVSSYQDHAIVVVNQAGKHRFTYNGPPFTPPSFFKPFGIATDSQSRILTADRDNHCIHILDQDGHFLRYIDNCELQLPWGLCVDTRDNLFVAEWYTRKVKKIQYYT